MFFIYQELVKRNQMCYSELLRVKINFFYFFFILKIKVKIFFYSRNLSIY